MRRRQGKTRSRGRGNYAGLLERALRSVQLYFGERQVGLIRIPGSAAVQRHEVTTAAETLS